jgi:hypothetical protein
MKERRNDRRPRNARSGFLAGVVLVALPLAAAGLALSACSPTVKVEAPKEPITINLNIKLDADVRLRIEEKAKEDVKTQPIF